MIWFYHSGDEKQAVGIMEVISKSYLNPKEKKWKISCSWCQAQKRTSKSCYFGWNEKTKEIQKLGIIECV